MTPATRIAAAILLGLLPASAATAQQAQDSTQDSTQAPDATQQPTEAAPGAADTDGAPTAEPPIAPEQPGGNLSLGDEQADAANPNQPQIYVRESHGDFEVRCLRAPEGQEDPCQLFQRLEDQGGNPTADINFFDLPDGAELAGGATVLTPLQTLLTAQVTLTIDGGQPRRYPFAFCDVGGCYARLGFTEEDLNRFRRGATARLVVVPALAPDQPAELDMSLTGFTAGFAAIENDG